MSGWLLTALIAALGGAAVQPSTKPQTSDRALLRIIAINVQPTQTAPATLHQLKVRVGNSGREPASDLRFQVSINGQRLPIYANQSYMTLVPAGKEIDVQLYNFWSGETGRPFPKDGRLAIEVQLTGARWVNQTAGVGTSNEVQPLPPPLSVTITSGTKP